jgi:hypothetical protein
MVSLQVPVQEFVQGMHKHQRQIFSDFDRKITQFFVVNWHRRARKTTMAINLLIRECCRHKNHVYAYIAPTYKQAKKIVWNDPKMLQKYLPAGAVLKKNATELVVYFRTGSILYVLGADNPDSLRGPDFNGVVLDEFACMKLAVWNEILRPVITQDDSRWAMFTFTPKGKNHAWDFVQRSLDPTYKHWKYYVLKASVSGIIPLQNLIEARKELPYQTYMQEFECAFIDDVSQVFKNVDQCIAGTLMAPDRSLTYVTGVDLAKSIDFTVLATLCRETRHLSGWDRFNQIDWTTQKQRIIEESRRFNSLCEIDATGVGDPIVEDLVNAGVSIGINNGVPGFKFNNTSKKQIIQRLQVAIEQRMITYPNIPELIDELKRYMYDVGDNGVIKYSAPEGYHDDCVTALALAVHGMKNYIYSTPVKHKDSQPNYTFRKRKK